MSDVEKKVKEEREKLTERFDQFFLAFCRTIGMEKDTFFYLYDISRDMAIFSNACTSYFNLPEVVHSVREHVLNFDFLLPESKQEFDRIHKQAEEGIEAAGIIKAHQANGVDTVVELKVSRILNTDGTQTPVCLGVMKDVTQKFIQNQSAERYKKILMGSRRFAFMYDKKKDCFKFFYEDAQTHQKQERTMFFYSKLLEEEKVCSKSDIPSLRQFIKYGSEIPIQIKFFDQFTEEFRWFSIKGMYSEEKPNELHGYIEDINDLDLSSWKNDRLTKVLNILSYNYLLILEVNLLTNRYDTLLIDDESLEVQIEEEGLYSEVAKALESMISKEHRKVFSHYRDTQELGLCAKARRQTNYEYKVAGRENKWHRVSIQRMDTDTKGTPEKVLLSFIRMDESEIINQSKVLKASEAAEAEKKQILVVEDYELNAAIMLDTIEELDMEGTWVSGKEEALKELQKQSIYYDMILLDDKLGDTPGKEVAENIRALNIMRTDEIPIILCSLEDSADLDAICKQSKITAHVSKPVTARQLKNLCDKYIT